MFYLHKIMLWGIIFVINTKWPKRKGGYVPNYSAYFSWFLLLLGHTSITMTISRILWTFLPLLGVFTTAQLVVNVKNKGNEILRESIQSNITQDTVTLEFQKSDGTLITQFIDFKSVSIYFGVNIIPNWVVYGITVVINQHYNERGRGGGVVACPQ